MSVTSIDYVFDFDRPDHGLSGKVAVLNPRTDDPQQAHLIFAKYVDLQCNKVLEIDADNGIWNLRVETETGQIVFSPQLNSFTVSNTSCDEFRKISFESTSTITELESQLKADKYFYPLQIGFLKAVAHVLPDLEADCYIDFDLLGDGRGDEEISLVDRRRRRRGKVRHEWRVPVGWDVLTFINCMKKCEKDSSWWEIWWHAWCVAKCLVKCASITASPEDVQA